MDGRLLTKWGQYNKKTNKILSQDSFYFEILSNPESDDEIRENIPFDPITEDPLEPEPNNIPLNSQPA